MASKLTEISTQYHTFVDNQVLTKKQLNEFLNYFDDQDRLTRVFLNGVGTVCGFKLTLGEGSVNLSPGIAVTTDGDLLQLKTATAGSSGQRLLGTVVNYSFYRPFDDDKAKYPAFRRLNFTVRRVALPNGKLTTTLIPLYELLTEQERGAEPLTKLDGWNEMAALLYLESYENKERCSAVDCDNQGLEQVNRLRVLALSKVDAEYLAKNDSIFSIHNVFSNLFNLPAVAVRRVVLSENSTESYDELRRAYHSAITVDGLVKDMNDGITQLVQNFGGLLGLNATGLNLRYYLSHFNSQFSFSAYRVPFDIQYRYDQLKDIVDTYNEIKDLLLSLKAVCLPEVSAFPKHILLGLLSETTVEPKQLRHQFYSSPAIGSACEQLEKAKSLATRLFALIGSYGIASGDVKITPSLKHSELSQKAIPFYYQVNEHLLKAWDYRKTARFSENYNLSYHTGLLSEQQKEPLLYNIDNFDFYRIEGHQGKDYRDVLEDLADMKKLYGLNFDVKALSVNLNTNTLDIDDYECEFEDLKVLLNAWTTEQDCILAQVADFFSNYSLAKPGTNLKYAAIDAVKKQASLASFVSTKATTASYAAVARNTGLSAALSRSIAKKGTMTDSKVVEQNLSTASDTLGATMKKAFDANTGGSVNDIVAYAKADLANQNLEAWKETDTDTKDLLLDNSMNLLAYTQILTKRMPTRIALVDTVKVQDYKLTLSQLCILVQKLKLRYESSKLDQQMKAYAGLLINQLSTVCCSGKKLEVLLEEVNARKEQILAKLQLSAFIQQHQGLEHKAGVEPGGTFVIVYKNSKANTNIFFDTSLVRAEAVVARETANISSMLADSKLVLTKKLLNAESLSTNERTVALKDAAELLRVEGVLDRLSIREGLDKFLPMLNVPDNTVVADFALPYMCCSGCSSVNFIVQKPAATLRLSRDRYCLLTDTEPILFEVSPNDGTVRAEPHVSGLVIEEGRITLNAGTFANEQLGLPIRFTVDNQVTDAILMVFPGIKADFEVPDEATSESTFTFTAFGENIEGARYFWQFGDGNSSELEAPSHTYLLPVNDENKVTVSLTVTAANGVCKYYVEHTIQFEKIDISIELDAASYCANDKTEYPFTVIPAGAQIHISGAGVIKNSTGGFSFIPAAAGAGIVSFMVDGEPSGLEVQIEEPPIAEFTVVEYYNQLILNNKSKNASHFVWIINGEKFKGSSTETYTIMLDETTVKKWNITLVATGAEVCPTSKASGVFDTKYERGKN
ncbi:MAG: PKD domain-containing protein [Mangrovibacterium sp.]